ncbi:MAG: GIY-YIG nuclease family protein, partial [Bacteroidota bacterium]
MKFYVYILYSASSDKFYVGYTHDVEARLNDHNQGSRSNQSAKYTFKHRPWELKAKFCLGEDRSQAIRTERYIKRQKSRKFIQQLIDSKDEVEQLAQLLGVPIIG